MPERVEARATTRIDLAGGTVDLWPLYLLHEHPLTVNAAIDLFAVARVEKMDGNGIECVSLDRQARVRATSVDDLRHRIECGPPAELEFPMRLTAHFLGAGGSALPPGRPPSCRITTDCQAPAGSGLGGSSALGIALTSALLRFAGRALDPDSLLAVTRAIETQVLRIPTGEQDYHPALRGGILALEYTVEGTRVQRLVVDGESLQRRTVLVYTGQSRSSGISNWDMLKRHLDGDGKVRAALDRVISATHALRQALLASDLDKAGAAIGDEWAARKQLSTTVTTPEIDRLIDAGVEAGAIAGKVCGAGGGGCLVLWARDGRREAVASRLSGLGARVIDVRFVASGVQVTET